MNRYRLRSLFALRRAVSVLLFACLWSAASGFKASDAYQSPRNSEREVRRQTSYIILHTTEAPAASSLRKLAANGEAHYCVDTDGTVYRIVDRRRVAFHSGRSMWNKRTDIDEISIGIETVGYHDKALTAAQYLALAELIAELKSVYKISDQNIMPHSQVAYGTPNRWHRKSHRGRKRCGMAFSVTAVRARLGLKTRWLADPDVKAGRLMIGDPDLAAMLYAPKNASPLPYKLPPLPGKAPAAPPPRPLPKPAPPEKEEAKPESPIIQKGRSAWDIARDAYNSAATLYTFPDGTRKKGNDITDWKAIPVGTKVTVTDPDATGSAVQIVSSNSPAADLAGDEALRPTTFYILANGVYHRGDELGEIGVRKLPEGTRVLVGYKVGGPVSAQKLPSAICPTQWNAPETFYLLRGQLLMREQVDMKKVPAGTMVFYKD